MISSLQLLISLSVAVTPPQTSDPKANTPSPVVSASAVKQYLPPEPVVVPPFIPPDSRPQDQLIFTDYTAKNWVYLPINVKDQLICKYAGAKRAIIIPKTLGEVENCSVGRGYIWAVATKADEKKVECNLYRCPINPKEGTWEEYASIDPSSGFPSMLIPLSDGIKFIGIAQHIGFAKPEETSASFIGIYKYGNGILKYDHDLELPFDKKEHIGKRMTYKVNPPENTNKDTESLEKNESSITYCDINPKGLTPSLWIPSISRDYIAVTAASAGVIWFFDLDSGRLKRTINLCGIEEKDIDKLKRLKWIIIGTSFAPSGNLIVAARQSDIVDFSIKIEKTNDETENKKAFEFMSKEFSNFQWWEIDPETGTKIKIENHVDYPPQSKSFSKQSLMRFLVDETGKIRTSAFSPWTDIKDQSGIAVPAEKDKSPEKNDATNPKQTDKIDIKSSNKPSSKQNTKE